MPFLRILRDKRGYETTYLVHWFRDGNRQRSKILYVFRTPPGVRVGRDVLDPSVVREIEAEHPDIEFDWRALVEHRQIIDQAIEPRRIRPKKKAEPVVEPPSAPVTPAQPPVPATVEGHTREQQLAFLARWYPELRDRVPHRTHDPARRTTLLALVERLNAAAWTSDEAVATGIQDAGEALQRLSRVFAKRRRKNRRAKRGPTQAGLEPAASSQTEQGGERVATDESPLESTADPTQDEPA